MENNDNDIDALCEQIHCMINPKGLDHAQRLHVHMMLLADAVAGTQCRDCRKMTVAFIKKMLPRYLNHAMKASISEPSGHVH